MADREELIAEVLSCTVSYYLGMSVAGEQPSWEDQAELIVSTIVRWVTGRHRRMLGRELNIALTASRKGGSGEGRPMMATRSFGSISLRKGKEGAYAYLPEGSLNLVKDILGTEIRYLHLRFDATYQGTGHLRSLQLASRAEIEGVLGESFDDSAAAP